MPYVDDAARQHIESGLPPRNAGELNYAVTRLCGRYGSAKGRSYATFNEVVGVLECAKQEFYRRVIAGYEEEKLVADGDVYPIAIQDSIFNDEDFDESVIAPQLVWNPSQRKWEHAQ